MAEIWESGCLDEGLIRMTDSAADTEGSVEEPESSMRMVLVYCFGGEAVGEFSCILTNGCSR